MTRRTQAAVFGAEARRDLHPRPADAAPLGPANVVITPGAKAALFALLKTVLRPGDEVLLLTPSWFGFDELVTRAGGTLQVQVSHLPAGTQAAEVEVALTETGLSSQVGRGENSGQLLRHAAVVRSLRDRDLADGDERGLRRPR